MNGTAIEDRKKLMDLELLSNEMRRNGISNGEMAKRLGISRSAFYRKMHGITDFYLKEIQKTGEILGYEVSEKIFFLRKKQQRTREGTMINLEFVRNRMQELDIGMSDLARLMGVTYATAYTTIHKQHQLTISEMDKLIAALRIQPEEIEICFFTPTGKISQHSA